MLTAPAMPFTVNDLGKLVDHVYGANTPKTYLNADLLYKADAAGGGNAEEEGAAQLFEAAFSKDGLRVTLQLEPGVSRPNLNYLALKSATEFVIWDISDWNLGGYDSLVVLNDQIFNEPPGLSKKGYSGGKPRAISHISIYAGESTGVPDSGSTILLLGGGLAALYFLRRARAAR